jgi:eukaryotic-like serine/threonine-protein kinase
MNCPSCSTPLEPGARFCGVCGYRLEPGPGQGAKTPPPVITQPGAGGRGPATPQPAAPVVPIAAPAKPQVAAAAASGSSAAARAASPRPHVATKPKPAKPEDMFLGQSLNGRFRIDSKIGEGGFGAVYRGVQLATGRKVALKLLHPEMTNDDNLVARFRREGLVLCNLRDAHTITTYDFDQTPDGTLYIAMELLEGRSLHQIFHDEAPIEWRRMFKVLTEMCTSLAEAHAQGIVHRDLKPENIYLEARPGNPEFVKILDFGIAKVMRGEGSMDPQAPQLTATGQTLGTLEYMSPEQLMGKQLDGRSDVYALGVLAYELITGRLPFPDAKGPAGLITAQLKQTPKPPSTVHPGGNIPPAVDKVLLRCLEKDKNNRFPDVTQLAVAAQQVLDGAPAHGRTPNPEVLETQRADPSMLAYTPPPPMPQPSPQLATAHGGPSHSHGGSHSHGNPSHSHGGGAPQLQPLAPPPTATPYPPSTPKPITPSGSSAWNPGASYAAAPARSNSKWVWLALGLLILGAATGAVLAYAL